MKVIKLAKLPWIEVLVVVLTLVFVAYVQASAYSSEQRLTPISSTPTATLQPWYMLGQYQPTAKPALRVSE